MELPQIEKMKMKSKVKGLAYIVSFLKTLFPSFFSLTPCLNPHHEIIINLIMPQASAYF